MTSKTYLIALLSLVREAYGRDHPVRKRCCTPIFLSLLLCEVKSQLHFANNLFDFRSGESPPEMIIYKCVKNGPILASGTRSITLLMRHQSSFVWDIFPPYFAVDSLRRWRSSGATGNICFHLAYILLPASSSYQWRLSWCCWNGNIGVKAKCAFQEGVVKWPLSLQLWIFLIDCSHQFTPVSLYRSTMQRCMWTWTAQRSGAV